MELLALFFIWPFLIIAFGLVFIAFEDLAMGASWLVFFAMIIILAFLVRESNKYHGQMTRLHQIKALREIVVILTIGLLIPVFIRYMFSAFENTLPVIIIGLALGFGFVIWGMFIKNHKVLMYANVIGGALSIIYVYTQLWDLGGLARVIAAAFGLVVAVVVSTIKLRDKLS